MAEKKIDFIEFGNSKGNWSHSYDPKNIFWVKCGKKQNVYDLIQEAREDTEIYTTLEKYGSIERMQIDVQDIYQDFNDMMDLRDVFEQQKRAEEIWYNIPYDEREKFGDNIKEFVKNGKSWLEEKIKKLEPEKQPEQPKESEVNNG